MQLTELNQLPADEAEKLFLQCCANRRWASRMVKYRPYPDFGSLIDMASTVWRTSTEKDFLEAFAGHPKIGDINVLRDRLSTQTHGEQGQVSQASDAVLEELHTLNALYEKKFGFIFIVCAMGKSAEEILQLLRERINNDRSLEIFIASSEQEKIQLLRLEKLLEVAS